MQIELCSLEHYDDVDIRQHFNINPDGFFVSDNLMAIVALGYAISYQDSLKKLLLIGAVASSAFYDEAKAN